jgi:uncharacterized Zn-binding protein involved in type VI secretion
VPDLEAARIADPVEHSLALVGLLAGLALGAALGAFTVATGGLGGIVAAAVIGGAAATGAGVGEVLGSLSFVPGITTGAIATGSMDTFHNDRLAARETADMVTCAGTPPVFLPAHAPMPIAQGSKTVFINDRHASRKTDKVKCSSKISDGSHNVFIGGDTETTMELDGEVPWVYHAFVTALGLASAVILLGPVVAALSFAGSMAGGYLATEAAAALGLGEDAQKIAGLLGSFAGGAAGSKAAGRIAPPGSKLANAERTFMEGTMARAPKGVRENLASTRGNTPWQRASRDVIARQQKAGTPAAEAAAWQGTPNYPGRDPLVNRTLTKDELYYSLEPSPGNPSGYFAPKADVDAFLAAGGTREGYAAGYQLRPGNIPNAAGKHYAGPGNPYGYKDNLVLYRVKANTTVAEGPTVANTLYGNGGMKQMYLDKGGLGTVFEPVQAPGGGFTTTQLPPSANLPTFNPANPAAANPAWSPFLGTAGAGSTAPLTQPGPPVPGGFP